MANAFVPEANALAANLNSIAAGGAYAIPYRFTTGAAGIGVLAPNNNLDQRYSTVLYLGESDTGGSVVSGALDQFDDSTSAIKGHIRIQKLGDPSKWLRFNVVSTATVGPAYTYRQVVVSLIDGSSPTPFIEGDAVMLFFQRTGDKGDKGDNGTSLTPMIHVREESAAGAAPATTVSQNTWVKRAFNTVRTNSVTGASLANNQITLPAGTYDYEGNAAGSGCEQHQARLINVTDNIVASELGTTEYTSGGATTRSVLTGRFVLSSPKVFEVQHRASSSAGSFGSSVNSFGNANVHAEIKFTKIA